MQTSFPEIDVCSAAIPSLVALLNRNGVHVQLSLAHAMGVKPRKRRLQSSRTASYLSPPRVASKGAIRIMGE